jgi:hypothetical protein
MEVSFTFVCRWPNVEGALSVQYFSFERASIFFSFDKASVFFSVEKALVISSQIGFSVFSEEL